MYRAVHAGPIGIIISTAVKRAEAAVIVVPTAVFLTMLPGILYYDLAFDMQRSFSMEVLLCLLPPSAAVMVMRSLCTMEALHSPLTWSTQAVVSNTPIHVYCAVLVFDFFLYCLVAEIYTWSEFRPQKRSFITPTGAATVSDTDLPQSHSHSRIEGRSVGGIPVLGFPLHIATSSTHYGVGVDPEVPCAHPDRSSSIHTSRMMDNTGLRVVSVSKSYETFDGSIVDVLMDVSADLMVGSVTSLLGSNGAGKMICLSVMGSCTCH